MEKQILDLTGDWQFKEYPAEARRMRDLDAQSSSDWLNCRLPSSIYTCLVKADVIDKNDLEANPENYLKYSKKSWIFKKTFDCDSQLLASDVIELNCEGLDTFCQIWLNEKLIAKTDNMFCCHRFEVKHLLKAKNNQLLVKCSSAIENGNRLMERFGLLTGTPHSLSCRNYVRKAQCQFGWDWAPKLPGCGIWKAISLEGFKSAAIRDIHIRTIYADSKSADIRVSLQIERFNKVAATSCSLTVLSPEGQMVAQSKLDFTEANKNVSVVLKINEPKLWYPLSYGSQPLYSLKAELFSNAEQVETSQKQFGIRTVQLNQIKDKTGSSFGFTVNNKSVHARGACWVPLSIFIGDATKTDYEKLLTTAKDASINMLRVWGGGVYETEDFYNLCDKLGIMVWQDFAFACAYYPDRSWFTDMIKIEFIQNITRLRNHPSLVIWCGNNEIDWLHTLGAVGKRKKFYGRNIYHKIIPHIISELDPDRDYISSTPLGSPKEPNNPSTGTVHQWNIWSGLEPTDNYINSEVPRFVAEFGMQSLPNKKVVAHITENKKIHTGSKQLEKHNYQPDGQGKQHLYINELFRSPANIEEFIYLSQVTQARGVRKNVEHLRCNCNINNGMLFWQFNESCPAAGWSCIDYQLGRKGLYYYTKRFYAPIIVAVSKKNLTAVAINNSTESVTAMLNCKLVDFNFNTIDQISRPVCVSPSVASSISLPQSMAEPKQPEKCFILLSLTDGDKTIAQNSFFYLPDKYIDWPQMKIDSQLSKIDDYTWQLSLSSPAVVKDLFIDTVFDAELGDNFFDLLDGQTKQVIVKTEEPIADLEGKISFTSVNSIFV